MRILDALGYSTRYVVDWQDHVWAEVLIEGDVDSDSDTNDATTEGEGSVQDVRDKKDKKEDQWIHIDPCEASIDEPMLYHGWGKNQTYIFAFTPQREKLHPLHIRRNNNRDRDRNRNDNSKAKTKIKTNSVTVQHRVDTNMNTNTITNTNKKMNSIRNINMSMSTAAVEDVTLRYTPKTKWAEVSERRHKDGIYESVLERAIRQATDVILK